MDAATLSMTDLKAFDPDAPERRTERRFLCPLCHGDRDRNDAHRSLSANVKTGVWWCHRCEAKGLLIEFRTNPTPTQNKPKSRQRLAAMPGSITQTQPSKPAPNPTDRGYDYDAIATHVLPIEDTPAAAYLERRGIPIEAIPKGARVRYMPAVPALKIRESVAFGLSDPKGQTVGLQLRNIEGTFKPIYKRTDVPHIFATPGAIEAERPIIVEAPIDALTVAACGFPSIATCGKSFPDALARTLALKPVQLAQDADHAGDEAAAKAAEKLKEFGAIPQRLRPNGAKDWNEYAQKWGIEALRQALISALGPPPTPPSPAPAAVDTPNNAGHLQTEHPEKAGYLPRTAQETAPDVFQAAKCLEFLAMPKMAQENCAWREWLNDYKKRPNAPDFQTVAECKAYVIDQWRNESDLPALESEVF